MRDRLPAHIGMTARKWKQHKRAQADQLLRALEAFRLGCAYTPAYAQVERITGEIKQMKDALSVKTWGR